MKRAWSASSRTETSCGFAAEARSVRGSGGTFLGQADDIVGGGEDRLGRAIISIERDDVGGRRQLVGKVEDVAHGRGAERVDRLGVVADDRQAWPPGLSASRIEDCRRFVS